MTFSPEPLAVRFDADSFWVELDDGRTLGVPLAWFPRLLHATMEQRAQVELSRAGLHWEELDEDISIAGLLAGRGDQTHARKVAA
ncbi:MULTISPECIES: DUF2442 domain-containing protein [unclassified Sphingobium]|jgi:Protein of unknown function (DUF2442)|uniref:DUF2442 domain-containing protein n=1 Tax=unclassified Sphingobium TaxID=2611147 RepID=UPI0004468062|nr:MULTISPECIES: DUF2442 domain-containing protein [unclassified Sphingobium]EXS70587.1 hypothetical protein BF95_16370 [Sphingobium sp. Ant17]PBN45114.1 DUF2442 domain-containing protein [Sphingobium sp. D43FB]